MGFLRRVPARKLGSQFGHPTQVSTQVQLAATRDYWRVRLVRALLKLPSTRDNTVKLSLRLVENVVVFMSVRGTGGVSRFGNAFKQRFNCIGTHHIPILGTGLEWLAMEAHAGKCHSEGMNAICI